jgi:Putative Flp pilus-assembly TadE/G-like
MGNDMLNKPATRPVSARILHQLSDFKRDERGAIAIFVLLLFFVMMLFGGIAVDVARFEMRRVTLQETMDRAVLAAASLTQPDDVAPKVTAEDWWTKAGLGDELQFEYATPTVTAFVDPSQRRVSAKSKVRSYNYFMGMMDIPFLEGPAASEAAQGVSQIEVMMVLDISGSMGEPAASGDSKKKIEALRDSADLFVRILKENDSQDQISIGFVPYNAQVNLPEELREQFAVTNLSTWGGVADQGVPYIDCIEIPQSTYTSTALSRTTSMRMAAVADTRTTFDTTTNFVEPTVAGALPSTDPLSRICNTIPDDAATAAFEPTDNHVFLPSKDGTDIRDRIERLTAGGFTSIALGMRWGTALLDESARPIYSAISDGSVPGRPADNDDPETRKIIILMTDGEHVSTNHIKDAYKSGPSPIYKGSDGHFAIRFWSSGIDLHDNTRPHQNAGVSYCSGWQLNTNREYFVPHLKRNSVKKKVAATEPEGFGTGADTAAACDPRAWVALATPTSPVTWPEYDAAGQLKLGADGKPITVTARQLDWSEVWAELNVSYVARQFYVRSNVSSTTYNNAMNQFRQGYIDATTLNTRLQENCKAARDSFVEIYGIAFAAPANGQTQIKNCASPSGDSVEYYYDAADAADLEAAFRQIATDITDLRLTQ